MWDITLTRPQATYKNTKSRKHRRTGTFGFRGRGKIFDLPEFFSPRKRQELQLKIMELLLQHRGVYGICLILPESGRKIPCPRLVRLCTQKAVNFPKTLLQKLHTLTKRLTEHCCDRQSIDNGLCLHRGRLTNAATYVTFREFTSENPDAHFAAYFQSNPEHRFVPRFNRLG